MVRLWPRELATLGGALETRAPSPTSRVSDRRECFTRILMRTFALASIVLLLGCGPSSSAAPATPAAPAPEVQPPAPRDGLDRTLALARACVSAAPHSGRGLGGTALVLDRYVEIVEADGAWRVTFTEEAPTSDIVGRSVRVDPVAQTCDGAPIATEVTVTGPSLRELFEAAWTCATAQADGAGIGGSPLVRESVALSIDGAATVVRASVAESAPRSIPSGWDVAMRRDGSNCGPMPMD